MDEIHHSYSLRAYALGIPAVVVPRSFLTVLFCFVFGLVRSLSLHGTYTQVWNGLVDNGHRKINDYSCWIVPDSWRNHRTAKQERDNTRARLAVQTGSKRISPKKRSTNFVEAHKAPTPQLLRYLA
ncbi:hypothetical protein L210DRAFT_3591413 [Boletus edulis BED1]|uniref:Uncharacterized protein n=1 Tax=Boletus edulis BED1 TaxID=1328754 RepID=A0AAD4BAA0_BOLED|nr:hypothetical protein L210DRAFT_3591413 [Boletus edulis BED1]